MNKSTSYKYLMIESLVYFFIFNFILIISMRFLRNFQSPTIINTDKMIGYSQYFGYPLYFDTIIVFLIIMSPIFCFIFAFIRQTYIKKV